MEKLIILKEIGSRCQFDLAEDELSITLHDPLTYEEFRSLTTSPLELLRHVDGDNSLKTNSKAEAGDHLKLKVPRKTAGSFVGKSLEDLITHGGWQSIPKELILLEPHAQNKKLYHSDDEQDPLLEAYCEAVNLSNLLRNQADHVSTNKKIVSIFDLHKVDIYINFSFNDLQETWKFPTKDIKIFIESDTFSELRNEAFTTTLWGLLKDLPSKERFSELLCKGDIFHRNLNYNFKLYKKDITIDKRLEKARADELALSQSIHKILLSVETKALAIPAILLVACKTSTSIEYKSYNNILLALGAVFVCFNLWFGWKAQSKMSETLEDEIDDALERVSLKSSELEKYGERFQRLKDRLSLANKVKLTSFIISVVMALWFTIYAIVNQLNVSQSAATENTSINIPMSPHCTIEKMEPSKTNQAEAHKTLNSATKAPLKNILKNSD